MNKQFSTWVIFVSVFMNFFVFAQESYPANRNVKDFYMLSIPKSGTHLLVKLLTMLSNRQGDHLADFPQAHPTYFLFEMRMGKAKLANRFVCQHLHLLHLFQSFSNIHPEYVQILQIRDLRDVIISLLKHSLSDSSWTDALDREMGYSASFDEKLAFFLDLPRSNLAVFLKKNIKNAIRWQSNPNVVVMRFEELVGPKGGGTLEAQQNSILKLANQLRIHLSSDELQKIEEDLFGNTGTFRKGQIGNWKEYFKPHHIELFEMKWRKYQSALGYP